MFLRVDVKNPLNKKGGTLGSDVPLSFGVIGWMDLFVLVGEIDLVLYIWFFIFEMF